MVCSQWERKTQGKKRFLDSQAAGGLTPPTLFLPPSTHPKSSVVPIPYPDL